VFDFVTMLAVIVGITFGAMELGQLGEAQEGQAVLELYQTIQTSEYIRGSSLIIGLPETPSPEELRAFDGTEAGNLMLQVRLTFEGLGFLVHRGDVDIEWIDELFRYMILTSWDKFEALTIEERELRDYPAQMEWHQWLVERLLARAGGASPMPAYEAYRDWTPR
jgi:hypothetical protein